ncbi:unnamed protein product [Spodoptera littoralis]|uniref:Uncharacterized protein n=1 Tax=Spodoptera littoralis TaxID=7109 RepID=A0A9P0I9W3_SPOLI|nr:unnamed protein product [Spodoptera littoralis]
MLVLFLILFTSVVAESNENKYLDLLPEDEKLQFIQQVARRILKDVQSQENKTEGTSKEINDELLKKHNEYVKAILKEESEYIRRRKNEKDKMDKPASGEDNKAFDSEKKTVPDDDDAEQVDLTLRNDRRGNANPSEDYIKVEIITDEPPIKKRSIQDDGPTKSDESDETTVEVLDKVKSESKTENFNYSTVKTPTRSTTAETILNYTTLTPEISTDNKSLDEDKNSTDTTKSENKVTEKEESTTLKNVIDAELTKGRSSGETDTEGAVSDMEEPWTRRSDNEKNISEINNTTATTSAVELFGLKSAEKNLDESNSEETITNQTKTATEKSDAESANNISTTVQDSDDPNAPKMRASNDTDTSNDVTATDSTTTITSSDERTTKPVPITTEIDKAKTSNSLTRESSIKTTVTKILVEEFTSPPVDKTEKVNTKNVNDDKKVIQQRALDHAREYSPQVLEGGKYTETGTPKNTKIKLHKLDKVFLGPKGQKEEAITKKPNKDKNFIELEKVYYDNNHKVEKGNTYQVYEISADKTPFIRDEQSMVEQPYYVPIYNYSPNNAYFNPQNRLGPNPGDTSVEKRDIEANDEAEDVPQLRSKPEKSDESDENIDKETTINNKLPIDMEYNESDFDDQRKKFGSKQRDIHSIHKQPILNYNSKKPGQFNPEDYADAEYYFGRLRNNKRRAYKNDGNSFPNSNENDHPAHSIQEGSLKDHVRAVRNILFHKKSFGLLDKDKYGHEGHGERSNIYKRGLRQIDVGKYKKKPQALRYGVPVSDNPGQNDPVKNKKQQTQHVPKKQKEHKSEEEQTILGTENKNNDIVINDEHIKKVGYLKSNNGTQELYVMDNYFKENVQKYIENQRQNYNDQLKPATPLPPFPPPQLPPQSQSEYAHFSNPFPNTQNETKVQSFAEHNFGDTHTFANTQNSFGNVHSFSAHNSADKQQLLNGGETSIWNGQEKGKHTVITKHGEDIAVETQEPLPEIVIPEDIKPHRNIDPLDNQQEIKSALLKELPEGDNLRENLNMNLNNRRKDGVKLGVYLHVLKDMVNTDNNALKQYDWLGSTVDIQSALRKIFELTGLVAARRKVHPADLEILKYVIFLHKLATEIIQANDFGAELGKKLALNQNSQKVLKEKGLINKVWLHLRKKVPDVYDIGAMRKLNKFLMSIEDDLYELHDAVKNVAKITKYKNQHWYDNLKDLYINTEDKNLIELLLHMSVLRLFVLIEEGTKYGLEDNYILYMKKHKKEAKRTLDEMIFVMQILDEYNKLAR